MAAEARETQTVRVDDGRRKEQFDTPVSTRDWKSINGQDPITRENPANDGRVILDGRDKHRAIGVV